MARARTDVEALFQWDAVEEFVVRPMYDCPDGGTLEIIRTPFSARFLVPDELRSEVVRAILEVKFMGQTELLDFTIEKVIGAFQVRDLMLDALLVHPDMVPLIKVNGPALGHRPKLFAHQDVPIGEIFATAEPSFLGVIPVSPEGIPGVGLWNPHGVIWGYFPTV